MARFPQSYFHKCLVFLSFAGLLIAGSQLGFWFRDQPKFDLYQEATLIPDTDGILLSSGRSRFASNNGHFALELSPRGNAVLSRKESGEKPLWWTSTGDGHGAHRLVFETHQDRTRIAVQSEPGEDGWRTVWHSDMEPACRAAAPVDKARARLVLSNRGLLSIHGMCDLFVPLQEAEHERSLAVIVTGLYRTNQEACKSHMANLISAHPSFTRVDVFAYILYEEDDIKHGRTQESISGALRDCYGDSLRTVDVIARQDQDVEYPGGRGAMLQPCGDKLTRLYNQLHTIDSAAAKWWAWSVKEGYTHDTILRIRPDTLFRSKPDFWALNDLGHDTVVLPHPKGEHYFYCAQMNGRVGVGTTDQIAYGSAIAMGHWLHMYKSFPQMVELAANSAQPAFRSFAGCEDLPVGPLERDCPRPASCSIECLVAWYLQARGVKFNVEWNWNQNLLR